MVAVKKVNVDFIRKEETMSNFLDNIFESKWFTRLLHIGLLAGSTYVAANPKYAWVIPLIQAIGQSVQPPR